MRVLVAIVACFVLASAQLVSAWAFDEGHGVASHHHFGLESHHDDHADDGEHHPDQPFSDHHHTADLLNHTLCHATASTSECEPAYPMRERVFGGRETLQPHDRLLLPPVPPPNIQTV